MIQILLTEITALITEQHIKYFLMNIRNHITLHRYTKAVFW